MLFLVKQTHSPQNCPIDAGGREALYDKPENVPGLKLVAAYGAFTEHTLYYIVEADSYDPVEKFLIPGFKSSAATISPVKQFFG